MEASKFIVVPARNAYSFLKRQIEFVTKSERPALYLSPFARLRPRRAADLLPGIHPALDHQARFMTKPFQSLLGTTGTEHISSSGASGLLPWRRKRRALRIHARGSICHSHKKTRNHRMPPSKSFTVPFLKIL